MDFLTGLPSLRLNQKSGTPSATGSFAAASKSATGIFVALESLVNVSW